MRGSSCGRGGGGEGKGGILYSVEGRVGGRREGRQARGGSERGRERGREDGRRPTLYSVEKTWKRIEERGASSASSASRRKRSTTWRQVGLQAGHMGLQAGHMGSQVNSCNTRPVRCRRV